EGGGGGGGGVFGGARPAILAPRPERPRPRASLLPSEVCLTRALRCALAVASALSGARASAAPPAVPPKLRLPADPRPVRQSIDLALDPAKERFFGRTDIEVVFAAPVSRLWLNAKELQIRSAQIEASGRRLSVTIRPGGPDFVGLEAPSPVGPGPAVLHLTYEGGVSRRDEEGLFAKK